MASMPVGGLRTDPTGSGRGGASLIVRNAKIFTGDPARPAASALAVDDDGRVMILGDDNNIGPLVGSRTRVVDAVGRRLIPGLNDSHLHVIRGGLNYTLELRWDGIPSLAVGLSMLRAQAERTPPGQWIRVVGGWTTNQLYERRLPTADELNRVAPDTPVFVLHLYQSAVLNRAALLAAGYTRDSVDPPGGQIVRDHHGTPTGMLLAAPTAELLYTTLAKAPLLDHDERKLSTQHFLHELNRFGLTSVIDAAGGFQSFPDDYAIIRELAAEQALTLRIAYHLFPQTAGQELDDLRRWVGTVRPDDGDEWLRLNGAGENLTWAAADFENFYEPRPELTDFEGEFEAALRLLADHGWGFRLHTTYDQTIRRDLAVFEKLQREGVFPNGQRWFFDHAETVTPESLDRIAALGGSISVQNRMAFQGEAFVARYGTAAAAQAPPIQAMLDRGITVAAGTDATRVSSYNPWVSLHWLVTGRTVGGMALAPASGGLAREMALKMYTANGAVLTGENATKGVLAPGFYADFAILTDDFLTVPENVIPHIESLLTVTGGKIVYAAGEFSGMGAPLPPVSPPWSPVAHFGGYQSTSRRRDAGSEQALAVVAAAGDSVEQNQWRDARGLRPGRLPGLHACTDL